MNTYTIEFGGDIFTLYSNGVDKYGSKFSDIICEGTREYCEEERNKILQPLNYITEVEEDDEGNLILDIPKELLDSVGWKTGDVLVWSENENGTYTLSKKI